MKKFITVLSVSILILTLYVNISAQTEFIRIESDILIDNHDRYLNKRVETEGVIVHICSVDGKKMKFRADNGAIIKIVSSTQGHSFKKSLYKKRVVVKGVLRVNRINKDYIDKAEKKKTLLCHIDNKPCKDSEWVQNKIKTGKADKISATSIKKLRKIMKETGKDYVSVITIAAEYISTVSDKK